MPDPKKIYNPNKAKTDNGFQNWYSNNTLEGKNKIPYSDNLDYDYYSFYRNGDYQNRQFNIQQHFPDTYKKPSHPTFSNESIYSTPENPGGSWEGETYKPDMSKLKKSIIKRYAKPNLKKYPNGTSNLYGGWGSNTDTSQIQAPAVQTYEQDPYQRTPAVTTSPSPELAGSKAIANKNGAGQYAQYAGAAIGAYGAYQGAQNSNQSGGRNTAAGTNAAIDSTLGSLTPWYGLAKTGEGIGKSFLDYDENGVAKTSTQRQANNLMTPVHTTALNHFGEGDTWGGIASLATGGIYDNAQEVFGKKKSSAPEANNYDYRTYDQMNPQYSASNGMVVPQQGGYPQIEYQGGESVYVPKGKGYVKYARPKASKDNQHEEGGIKSPLPEGAVIFSKRFSKKADEAYEANDMLRMKALIQQQDNHNVRQGNPINGSYGQTMKYGGRVGKYGFGTSDLMYMNELEPQPTPPQSPDEMNIPSKKQKNPGVFRNGGMIRKYEPGTGNLQDYGYDPAMFAQNYMGGQAYGAQQGTQGQYNTGTYVTGGEQPPTVNRSQPLGPPNPYSNEFVPGYNPPYKKPPSNYRFPYGMATEQTILGLVQNAGNFRDINEAKHWDKVNYGSVTPEHLDPAMAIRSAKDQAAAARYALRESAGGNAGMYLSNLRGVTAQRSKDIADTMYQYNNANAEIGNKAKYYNKELDVRGQIDEGMNKGKAHDLRRAALAQIGENAANQYRDYKGNQLNQYEANLFYQMYPNFPKNAPIPPELINYYKRQG